MKNTHLKETTVGDADELNKEIEIPAMAPFHQLMLNKNRLIRREKEDYFIVERERVLKRFGKPKPNL